MPALHGVRLSLSPQVLAQGHRSKDQIHVGEIDYVAVQQGRTARKQRLDGCRGGQEEHTVAGSRHLTHDQLAAL